MAKKIFGGNFFVALWLLLPMLFLSTAQADILKIGELPPAWKLLTIGGKTIEFPEGTQSNPTIVVFWASWCPYCKALMPKLAEVKEAFPDKQMHVYAINFAEDEKFMIDKKMKSLPFEYFLKGDDIARQYGIDVLPAFFITLDNQVVYIRDYPPNNHPSQKIRNTSRKAELLAEWWRDRALDIISQHYANELNATESVVGKVTHD